MQQDRLAELLRQRALVAEHLAWIDREIYAAGTAAGHAAPLAASPALAAARAPATGATGTVASPVPELGGADTVRGALPAATATVAEFAIPAPVDPSLDPEPHTADIRNEVRRGCLLYSAIAALLGIGGVALMVWAARSYNEKHPPALRTQTTPESR